MFSVQCLLFIYGGMYVGENCCYCGGDVIWGIYVFGGLVDQCIVDYYVVGYLVYCLC